MKNQRLEAIRKLEVRRMNELTAQIEEWNNSDFEGATILIEEGREDSDLLDALEKIKQLAELTINLDYSVHGAFEAERIRSEIAKAAEKAK